MIKLLSSGELEPNQYVTIFEYIESYQFINPISGEIEEKTKTTPHASMGLPLRIVSRAGPIIECLSYTTYGQPLSMMLDSRKVHFLEIDKQHYIDYYKRLGFVVNEPKETAKVEEKPITPETKPSIKSLFSRPNNGHQELGGS